MPIEQLHIMPPHEKVEDGYSYNPKYIGKVYQFKDQLIYFKEKSTLDYPLALINAIKTDILESVDPNLQTIYDSIEQLGLQLKKIEETQLNDKNIVNSINQDINEIHQSFDLTINKLRSEINNDEILNIQTDISKIKKEVITKLDLVQIIDKVIDDKLTAVYNNFNTVTQKLVTDAITEALKDSKRDQSGKLKITTLMMLKEMGLTPDEIIKYSESGLV